jgi:hypothetical protein
MVERIPASSVPKHILPKDVVMLRANESLNAFEQHPSVCEGAKINVPMVPAVVTYLLP